MVEHGGYRWLVPALVLTLALAVAGCAARPLAPPASLDPPRAAAPLLTVASTASTVGTVPVDSAGVVVTASSPVALSPEGPWQLVEHAPGVNAPGLAYELAPGLWAWLPVDEDVRHGVVWTFTEADREVVEAYLQARLTIVRAVRTSPFDDTDPGWSRWFLDGGRAYGDMLRDRQRRGEVYTLDRGVVLRPTVLGEERSDDTAIVFDCMLDGGLWVRPDGSAGEGTRWGIFPVGIATRLRRVQGEWRIEHLVQQPEACA